MDFNFHGHQLRFVSRNEEASRYYFRNTDYRSFVNARNNANLLGDWLSWVDPDPVLYSNRFPTIITSLSNDHFRNSRPNLPTSGLVPFNKNSWVSDFYFTKYDTGDFVIRSARNYYTGVYNDFEWCHTNGHRTGGDPRCGYHTVNNGHFEINTSWTSTKDRILFYDDTPSLISVKGNNNEIIINHQHRHAYGSFWHDDKSRGHWSGGIHVEGDGNLVVLNVMEDLIFPAMNTASDTWGGVVNLQGTNNMLIVNVLGGKTFSYTKTGGGNFKFICYQNKENNAATFLVQRNGTFRVNDKTGIQTTLGGLISTW